MKTSNGSKFQLNHRFAIISCVVMAAAILTIVSTFNRLYIASKQNIQSKWRSDTMETAHLVNQYIKTPMDAISFSAVRLNEMLRKKDSYQEALDYLINETETYSSVISENSTGIYAYYKRKFLDGNKWQPPENYNPKDRPWYTAAFEAGGTATLVVPYLNIQTDTMMMSVSELLDDLESAVSMDIYLDTIQKIIEKKITADNAIESAFVMNRRGIVIAHSDKGKISMNLAKDGSDFEKKLVKKFTMEVSDQLEEKSAEGDFTVFAESVNSQWLTVFVLNNGKLYYSLRSIYITSGIVMFFVMAMIFLTFLYMSHKYAESKRLGEEVQAAADIYVTAARINLQTDSISIIRSNSDFDSVLGGDFTNYSKRTEQFAEKITCKGYANLVKDFLAPSSLPERLSAMNSVSVEFVDDKKRWVRLRYIVINRNESQNPLNVMLVFESIDADRKQQEALRKLSETDLMTGLKNRGCGENLVRKAIADGKHGMFCLMDADKFKSINDTFGHQAGDSVIISIACALKKAFRDSDIIFRLGGDEFAIFSAGVTTEALGLRILDRFFDEIDHINLPELQGRKITVSVGATFYPQSPQDSFEAMYQRADKGTYNSKKREGNMLTFNI